nr:unnamed protein product [Digitaria exilis]
MLRELRWRTGPKVGEAEVAWRASSLSSGAGVAWIQELQRARCLGIADSDGVELGKLHRQAPACIIHIEAYVGHPKVKSAAAALPLFLKIRINSYVKVTQYHLKLKPKVALEIVRQYP